MYFVVYPIRDGNLTRLKFWSTELILIFRILTQIFRFWVGFEPKNWGPIKIQVKVRFKPTHPTLKKKKSHTNTHSLTVSQAHITHAHITHAHSTYSHSHTIHVHITIHISQNQIHKSQTLSQPIANWPNTIIVNHAVWIYCAATAATATAQLLQSTNTVTSSAHRRMHGCTCLPSYCQQLVMH